MGKYAKNFIRILTTECNARLDSITNSYKKTYYEQIYFQFNQ